MGFLSVACLLETLNIIQDWYAGGVPRLAMANWVMK
jgi:hypothetical protein